MMRRNVTYQTDDYLQSDYSQKPYRSFIDKYIADYDVAGRLHTFTNFNGTVTAYSYDNANRLTAINNKKADNSVISNYTFTLDGDGNRTNIVQNEPYAQTINEITVAYTYNAKKNRLSSAGSNTFTYDDEGQIATGGSNTYTFDYEHRLKTIGGTSSQFFYDGSGNRLKAVRSGGETRYIYDASGRLLAEANASNVITRYYIYGNGLLAMVTPEGQTYCYHFNGVGSTVAITDNTQAIVNQYSYDAFGNVANQQENMLNNDTKLLNQPFKYVGKYGVMKEPNGFYYMKARYYDPTVGGFISEDPIGFGGSGVNLMAYVGNNPVTGIDPSGEIIWPRGDYPTIFGANGQNGLFGSETSQMKFIGSYIPFMYQTAIFHDPAVDYLAGLFGIKSESGMDVIRAIAAVPCFAAAVAWDVVTLPLQIYELATGNNTELKIFNVNESNPHYATNPGGINSVQGSGNNVFNTGNGKMK